MIQGKTVVDDVITTQTKGVETKGSDAKIPEKKDGIKRLISIVTRQSPEILMALILIKTLVTAIRSANYKIPPLG